MSRTYRKNSITDGRSKVAYINNNMDYPLRHYRREYYFPEGAEAAYEAAMKGYYREVNRYYRLYCTCFAIEFPTQPRLWDYRKYNSFKVEYDYEKERNELAKEYDAFKRDGKLSETGRSRSFKKHCASELRMYNRMLVRKIVKDDEDWEQKPYPDTYLGKQHIWDYW